MNEAHWTEPNYHVTLLLHEYAAAINKLTWESSDCDAAVARSSSTLLRVLLVKRLRWAITDSSSLNEIVTLSNLSIFGVLKLTKQSRAFKSILSPWLLIRYFAKRLWSKSFTGVNCVTKSQQHEYGGSRFWRNSQRATICACRIPAEKAG